MVISLLSNCLEAQLGLPRVACVDIPRDNASASSFKACQ